MNDFIFLGFKLKGSSSLELKTDLRRLWNEQSTHSLARHGDLLLSGCTYKTNRNYNDGRNAIFCTVLEFAHVSECIYCVPHLCFFVCHLIGGLYQGRGDTLRLQ